MKFAAIIAVLALGLTAPSTALARIYFGVVRYAKPHATGAAAAITSEAPYLSYVRVTYNSHSGTLVMKYAFYQPSHWNMPHMPHPPEVLLGPACTRAEGLEILAEPHEFLFEVGQASSADGRSSRPLGLAYLAGYGQIRGTSPLSFKGGSYRVAVASGHFRARKWRCLTVAPTAQAGPAGPYSLELDEPASVNMSATGKAPAAKGGVLEARLPKEQRERREERQEERTAERQEQRERREEHAELRVEARKEHALESKTEREEREELEQEQREEREEREELEQEQREEAEERERELHKHVK
jgi:hypothetical protein